MQSTRASTTTVARRRRTPPITRTTTVAVEQPGWSRIATDSAGIALDTRTITFADGSQVLVARFRAGHMQFALHVGTQDPPTRGLTIGAGAGPTVTAAERPALLAAFNGGFRSSSGAGGVEVNHRVLEPLTFGRASLVIDADGTGHVGVWGQDLPRPGESVDSVRQNLAALVHNGQPAPTIGDVSSWGATLGHRAFVARSALGEDGHSNMLYAASMAAVPADLARALIDSGATTAMELDINPQWVQLAVAPRPGGALTPAVPGQHRPANQYLLGWTRDFVTVLDKHK